MPAVVYLPFVALWGKYTPDTIINATFGALNVLLLMTLLSRFSRRFDLKLDTKKLIFLGVFWAAGTVHFYMSMMGSVWFVSQGMEQ